MSTPITRYWLFWVTLIEALFAFFQGVFFSVWGEDLTSPPWLIIMADWHGPRLWGTILCVSGALFLFGLQHTQVWPRILGCALSGFTYLAIGIMLMVAPAFGPDSISGSVGIWLLAGTITLCLAGFMYSDHYAETPDDRIDDANARDRKAHRQD